METPGLSHKFAMKNYLSLLCSTSLFNGLTAEELQTLLSQLGAVVRSYGKGEALVLAGEPSRRVGIVLNGELEAYRRLLTPVLAKTAGLYLRTEGFSPAVTVEWSPISLQDEAEEAEARLTRAKAEELERKLAQEAGREVKE